MEGEQEEKKGDKEMKEVKKGEQEERRRKRS